MANAQPYTTVRYAKDVFQDSLITGIPQIVTTKNVGRKVIKTLVLCLCLIGFIYQTTEFMKIFWKYPTVLDIDVEYPEIIESPAITFCNLNGIKRSHYCDKYPEHCISPENKTAFCSEFPEICKRQENGGLELDVQFPTGDGMVFEQTTTVEDLDEMGHSSSDILKHCKRIAFDGYSYIECSWDTVIRMPMSDGNTGYRNCYTLFSSVTSSKLKQHVLPVPKRKEPLFHMVLEMEPDEYFRPDRQVGVIVAIHSPNNIINPFYDGFVVKPGRMYSVHLKVVEERLLPFPYETRCKDYSSLWLARGRKGPLSQEMCLGECVYNASMKLCNCVIPNILYYHEERVCTEDEMDCFDFNLTECYNYCHQPCDFTDFEYDVQERKLENNEARDLDDLYDKNAMTKHMAVVLIFLKRPEIIIYKHRPQYEDIEVFSFMGGYVGMWLGVSLIAVFDFLESVVLICYFWMQRRLKIR
uniref:Putative degenerin n=1 Tax=Cupiennius salei TaxID=6928 RepID=T1D1T8_CUPSA